MATLELHYLDSLVETVDLQSGYFLAFVAPERAIHGAATPGELVAKSQDGTVVATEDVTSFFVLPDGPVDRPVLAEGSPELLAFEATITGGRDVELFIAKVSSSTACARLSIASLDRTWTCSSPQDLPNPMRVAIFDVDQNEADSDRVVLGVLRPRTRVEIVLADGSRRPVDYLASRNFIAVLPATENVKSVLATHTPSDEQMEIPLATR